MSSLGNIASSLPTRPASTPASFGRWPLRRSPRWLRKSPLSLLVPAGLLLVIVVASILANVVAPYDPNALDVQNMLAKPSTAHLLGTDQLGRDVLSRVLYGGR